MVIPGAGVSNHNQSKLPCMIGYLTGSAGFYINLPLGILVAIPIMLINIPEQVPKQPIMQVLPKIHHVLDLVGFLLLAGATIELLLALQYGGNRFSWDSSQVIGLFIGSGVTFLMWVAWNHKKGDESLLPFSMIRRKTIWASATNYSFLMATLFGSSFYLPIYFQAVKGVNAIMSGVYLLPTILPQLVFAILSGVLGMSLLHDAFHPDTC